MDSVEVSILAGVPNPFEDTVSSDAWRPEVDVEAINAGAFARIWQSLETVCSGPGSRALVVHGPKGSGKTHLLGRVRSRIIDEGHEAPDRVTRAVFVYVRLDTNPELLWQHVRRKLVQDLLRRQQGLSQLQRLIAHELAAARSEPRDRWVRALRVLIRAQDPVISEFLEEVEDRAELGRELRTVIEHLMFDRHRSDAKAWLRGDFLPEEALTRLGVNPEAASGEDPEDAAKAVTLALLRLADHSLPIALCFDQLESIQRYPGDTDALFRFGRVAADIVDVAPNLLLLTCVQTAFLEELRQGARGADQDRFAPRDAPLELFTGDRGRELAAELLVARMDAMEPLAQLRAGSDRLFPFDDRALDELLAEGGVGARELLARAAREFDRRRSIVKPQRDPAELLAEVFDQRVQAAERRELDLEATLGHGLPLFVSLGITGDRIEPGPTPRDVLVSLRRGPERVDVALFNHRDARHLRYPAARLDAAFEPKRAGLCLLREPHRPLRTTAVQTRACLESLISRGARLVSPSTAAMAVLEAIRSLLSDARAGDLTLDGVSVEADFVARWLAEKQALLGELPTFVDALHGEGSAPDERLDRIRSLVDERRVVALPEAAEALGLSVEEVLSAAERDGSATGVIPGEPTILFAVRSGQVDLREREIHE